MNGSMSAANFRKRGVSSLRLMHPAACRAGIMKTAEFWPFGWRQLEDTCRCEIPGIWWILQSKTRIRFKQHGIFSSCFQPSMKSSGETLATTMVASSYWRILFLPSESRDFAGTAAVLEWNSASCWLWNWCLTEDLGIEMMPIDPGEEVTSCLGTNWALQPFGSCSSDARLLHSLPWCERWEKQWPLSWRSLHCASPFAISKLLSSWFDSF